MKLDGIVTGEGPDGELTPEELINPPNDAWVLVEWNGQIYKSKVGNIRRSE